MLGQIAQGIPLARVLEDLLRVVEAQSDHGMRTSILLVSEDGRHLRHGAAPNLPAAYNEAIDGIAIGEGVGSCGTVASRGAAVYVTDIASDPLWMNFRDLALAHQLRACWSTPIKAADDSVLGTFAIYYDACRSPTQDEIAAIGFVTQTVALAIERHRHDRRLEISETQLQSLNAVLRTANIGLHERVATSTKDIERAWRLSQELLVTALPDGTFEAVNPMWTQLLGWEEHELVGASFEAITHPDDLSAATTALAGIMARPLVVPHECRSRHKDGSYRWFGWTAAFAGIAVGGSDGEFSVPNRSTSGSTTGGHIAFYDLAEFGPYYGASSTSASFYQNRTTRVVAGFGGLGTETERGSFFSDEFRSRLEFGRHFANLFGTGSATIVTPFVALELAELRTNGFGEQTIAGGPAGFAGGPGLFALNVSGQSTADVPSFVGARFQSVMTLGNGMRFSPTLQLAYEHEFAPYRQLFAGINSLPGAVFLVDGARPARDAAQVKAGGELAIGPRTANFDGEFSGANQFYAGKGGVKVLF